MKTFLAAILFVAFASTVHAAKISFTKVSDVETHYNIIHLPKDVTKAPVSYIRSAPVGPAVSFDIPGVPGDCYAVSAINRGGPSPWTFVDCIPEPAAIVPATPGEFVVAP